MQDMLNIQNISAEKKLLTQSETVAVVGLSPKENRPSNMIARYLLENGYTVIPVNPGQSEILGQTCYASLDDVPVHIDIVNIFRRSEDVYPIVESAVTLGAKCVWMQEGIVNIDAASYAREHGMVVIMDRCIMVVHQNIFGSPA